MRKWYRDRDQVSGPTRLSHFKSSRRAFRFFRKGYGSWFEDVILPTLQCQDLRQETSEWKKKQRHREHERARKDSGSDPGIDINTACAFGIGLSHITCFHCDQQGHYATKSSKLKERRKRELIVGEYYWVISDQKMRRLQWCLD